MASRPPARATRRGARSSTGRAGGPAASAVSGTDPVDPEDPFLTYPLLRGYRDFLQYHRQLPRQVRAVSKFMVYAFEVTKVREGEPSKSGVAAAEYTVALCTSAGMSRTTFKYAQLRDTIRKLAESFSHIPFPSAPKQTLLSRYGSGVTDQFRDQQHRYVQQCVELLTMAPALLARPETRALLGLR